MIPVFKPWMDEQEIDEVRKVIESGWIGLGPKTKEFEEELSKFFQSNVSVVNSCTSALDLTLKLLGVGAGDEVIVPAVTFVSTAHAVKYNLATPVFADVDYETLLIDIQDVKKKITPRTKAIIPVHYAGRMVNIEKLREQVGDIKIIEDCAHAMGTSFNGKKSGTFGDAGCFSFHAVKNLAMGDGGAIVSQDKEIIDRSKKLRWLGIDKGTWTRTDSNKSYWWEYGVEDIGLKCHANDILSAIGLVQLYKLEEANNLRKHRVQRYIAELSSIEQIELPQYDDESSWHLFCIKCEKRDELSLYLKENGVSTGVHYKPIHLYTCYGNIPRLPVAELIFEKILTLPLFPSLTDSELQKIIFLIHKFYDT